MKNQGLAKAYGAGDNTGMRKTIRFGDFTKEVQVNYHQISYKDVFPKPEMDEQGKELPFRPARIDLRATDVYRLLRPYGE